MSDQTTDRVSTPSADTENRSSITRADVIIFAAILLFGTAALFFYQQSTDFVNEDVFYVDCARSLLQHGFYGIAGRPETTQPPGLTLILATLFMLFGYGHGICLAAMAVFETLGFVIAYELLRHRIPRFVAGTLCILLISSPISFVWTTRMVFPTFPLLFTTMAALLVCDRRFLTTRTLAKSAVWSMLLTLAVIASLMIASVAIALLGAILATVLVTLFRDQPSARFRLRWLAPVFLMGILVQGVWMYRTPAPAEWPLPGYPASYLEQLKVKLGNFPELGLATAADIPLRIKENLFAQSDELAMEILRHGLNTSKTWVVSIPVLLVLAGWLYSVGQTGGGILEWYFAGYEAIVLLWPWKFEFRFFLPISPLACLFLWKGLIAIGAAARAKPRTFGIVGLAVGALFTISGYRWIHSHGLDSGLGAVPEFALLMWLGFTICAACMAYTGRALRLSIPEFRTGALKTTIEFWTANRRMLVRYAGSGVIILLVLSGARSQARIAYENVRFPNRLLSKDPSLNPMAPEVESGLWIRSHTPSNAIVMARHLPIVYHYSERNMVWFAPISDPDVLMEGIVKHNVNYVVVIKHPLPYYLPDDDYCFDRLIAKRRDDFRLVFHDSNLRIFEVEPKTTDSATQPIT